MIPLIAALLLAAAPAPLKPDTTDVALDCSAYLALAVSDAEAKRKVDEPLQRQYEAWIVRDQQGMDPDELDSAGEMMASRAGELQREPRKLRAAHTAWCRANAPLEKSA